MRKKFENYIPFVFVLSDIALVILAAFISFMLRFDGMIPAGQRSQFFAFTVLAVISTLFVFISQGLYRISWKYVSLTDLPYIFASVVISSFTIGAALFVLRDVVYFGGFPRSIVFLYAIILFLLTSFLRFLKRIYWQIIKPELKHKEFDLPLSKNAKNNIEVKNVLITGGAGYIGSVLVRSLLEDGYNVKVLDKLLFGEESIKDLFSNGNFQFIKGDIFDKDTITKILPEIDAVVNLAAIVGEPACVCQKDVALKINYLGAVYIAKICKAYGIKKFIQASTCSTYGQNEENRVAKEGSSLFPVDFYGETKIYAEREIMKLVDESFAPTILRFSTIYGLSPRMRFDLVVNTLTKKAIKDGEITIFGGEQWRPLLHVNDVARAVLLVLKAPLAQVGSQIFNVGNNKENYTINKLGNLVKKFIPAVKVKIIEDVQDKRNYKVDFSKIERILNFLPQKKVEDGIIEIRDAINRQDFVDLEDKKYYNHLSA